VARTGRAQIGRAYYGAIWTNICKKLAGACFSAVCSDDKNRTLHSRFTIRPSPASQPVASE
jgi:hypothetical protein